MIAGLESTESLCPADVCRALPAALEAADGRRRKRDQTPDAFGLSVKRELLTRLAHTMGAFRRWLEEGAPSEDAGRSKC